MKTKDIKRESVQYTDEQKQIIFDHCIGWHNQTKDQINNAVDKFLNDTPEFKLSDIS